MEKEKIQNLIKELIEKTTIKLNEIKVLEENPQNLWISVDVSEPHFFISRNGEGLNALNHLIHRILEDKTASGENQTQPKNHRGILVDINDFQKRRIENIRAVAHMMSERARYFKSSIEVDPMPAFERRIIHEFLSEAEDLKTESTGTGRERRVVIKYTGAI